MIDLRALLWRPRALLLIGLAIREALSPWTGHPFDMEVWIRNAYYVSQGQNPYAAYMAPVPGLSFAYLQSEIPSVGYLPLWSLLAAGLYRAYSIVPGASRFVFYFLLKQPPIVGDVCVGWLLFRAGERWTSSRETAMHLLRYWMFFPYTIIITAVWGQFDSIVVALLLTFLLVERRTGRILSLGLGVTLKWFPVILLPLYGFRERFSRNGMTLLSLAVPIGVTLLVFTVAGWDYHGVTAMATAVSHGGGGGVTAMSILQLPAFVSFFASSPLLFAAMGYLWVPGISIAGYVAHRRFSMESSVGLVQAVLLVIVSFYLTRWGVNEQYLMYLFPLFLIDVAAWHPERRPLFSFLVVVTTGFVIVNNDLLLRFLGPLSTTFVEIAFAADSSPDIGVLRQATLHFLSVLSSVTLVQIAATLLRPNLDPRPWPMLLAAWIRRRMARRARGPYTNP